MKPVRLLYHRPPDRNDVFEQRLVARENGCYVTLLDQAELSAPMRIADRTVLENGASIVWFSFEGAWHDIGRFHNAQGEFTGYYANAIMPVTFHSDESWECTDLFLDVWLGPDGVPAVLDEAELERALTEGWIDAATGHRARVEVAQIFAGAAAGVWPPDIAKEWTLERVRANN